MTYLRQNWRPLLALVYGVICLADFVLFPITWPLYQQIAWISLTTQNGGMLHISFGGILAAAAYTRGKEKIAAIETGTEIKPGETL